MTNEDAYKRSCAAITGVVWWRSRTNDGHDDGALDITDLEPNEIENLLQRALAAEFKRPPPDLVVELEEDPEYDK